MAKIKKTIGDEKKLKQYRSTLNTTKKRNALRNRGTLNAILPAPLKSSRDVNLVNPVKRGLLTEKKPTEFGQKNVNLQKLNGEKKKDKVSKMKDKRVLDSKTTIAEEKYDNEKFSKTKKKIKDAKYTPKIKKTTTFKNKTPRLKVKTALMFNQKFKKENEDNSEVNLNDDTVKSGIQALFDIIEENKSNKTLFQDELPIFLQFSSIKIGKTPSRTVRIPLKHSLLMDSSEVCLITDDVKGHNQKEYEKTIEHYEILLKEKNVTNIKSIMPYYQLRTDYSEFELKRKLVELYDIFLVDAKLSGYVVKKLGKIFRDKRKLPIPIRLDANNLKDHINFALSKTSTNLHPHGDNFIIQIGHSNMTQKQIYENIIEACTNLAKQFPGGWCNIKGLNLKTAKSVSVPIYYTMKNPSKLSVPIAKAKRPKAFKAVTDELSTICDKKVTVLPFGKVLLCKNEELEQTKSNRKRKTKRGKSNLNEQNINISQKNDEFKKSKQKKCKSKEVDIKINNSSKHNLKMKLRALNGKPSIKKVKTSAKSKEKEIKKQVLNKGKKMNITNSKKLKIKNK